MSPKTNVDKPFPNLLTMLDRGSNGTDILLDRNLSVSQVHVSDEVKKILTGVIRQAIVTIYHDFYYRVDFGPSVRPQYHVVTHDFWCSCALDANCAAVIAVRMYLRDGGEPANTPRPGYFLTVPHACPVCGAKAYYHPQLSSQHRGLGWSCEKAGTSHYWQHQGRILRNNCPA